MPSRAACAAHASCLVGACASQDWGSRALSIITYESAPLRERAKKAGAKMQWLMGLTESMAAAANSKATPVSKTGRTPQKVPSSGRMPRAVPGTVRGF